MDKVHAAAVHSALAHNNPGATLSCDLCCCYLGVDGRNMTRSALVYGCCQPGRPQNAYACGRRVRSSVDFGIVADNIVHIADLAVEKHKCSHGDLAEDERTKLISKIQDALWIRVGEFRAEQRRKTKQMFKVAEAALLRSCRSGAHADQRIRSVSESSTLIHEKQQTAQHRVAAYRPRRHS